MPATEEHQEQRRPIIIICHSLGGIVAKEVSCHQKRNHIILKRVPLWLGLVLAQEQEKRYPNILDKTHSILFLATPHRGSKTADIGLLLSRITTLTLQHPAKHLLETLRLNSTSLETLNQRFRKLVPYIMVVSFYERKAAPIIKTLVMIYNAFNILWHR